MIQDKTVNTLQTKFGWHWGARLRSAVLGSAEYFLPQLTLHHLTLSRNKSTNSPNHKGPSSCWEGCDSCSTYTRRGNCFAHSTTPLDSERLNKQAPVNQHAFSLSPTSVAPGEGGEHTPHPPHRSLSSSKAPMGKAWDAGLKDLRLKKELSFGLTYVLRWPQAAFVFTNISPDVSKLQKPPFSLWRQQNKASFYHANRTTSYANFT